MRVPPTDPHHRVWLLALSVAPILIRHDRSLQAEPCPDTAEGSSEQRHSVTL